MTYQVNTPAPNTANPEPTLEDILNEHQRWTMMRTNCHSVGRITSFDSSKQTARVQIVYKRGIVTEKPNGQIEVVEQEYPLLADVPVVCLYGGDSGLTFPIKAGDFALVCFNDRDLDIFLKYGQSTVPNTGRMHDLGDAIAIVGIRPFSKPLANYDTQRAKLYNKNTQVAVKDGKVKVDNGTQNLRTALEGLIQAFTNNPNVVAVTATAGNPSPINPAILSALNNVLTQVNNLLE